MGNSEARGAKEGNYGGKIDRANSRLVWPHGLVSLRGGGNGRLAGRLGFSCRDDRFIHRRRTLAGPARSGSCSGTACASDPEGSTNCRQGFASGHYLGDFWCDRSHGARRRSVCLVVRPILGTGIWRAGTASIDMDKFPNAGRNSFAAPVVKTKRVEGRRSLPVARTDMSGILCMQEALCFLLALPCYWAPGGVSSRCPFSLSCSRFVFKLRKTRSVRG
jgi:hypothetical protein